MKNIFKFYERKIQFLSGKFFFLLVNPLEDAEREKKTYHNQQDFLTRFFAFFSDQKFSRNSALWKNSFKSQNDQQ